MKPPMLLKTPRLQLRPPLMSDAETIFTSYAQDPQVTRYLVWRSHQTIETTYQFLQHSIAAWETEQEFPWVILRQEDHQIVGMIRVRMQDYRADFGYVLARTYWGQEFATEVVRMLVNWMLAQRNIQYGSVKENYLWRPDGGDGTNYSSSSPSSPSSPSPSQQELIRTVLTQHLPYLGCM